MNSAGLEKDSNFEKTSPNFFRVKHSNYKNGVFYEENDLLKIEEIKTEDLKEMAEDLQDNLVEKPNEIIFYDLDEFNLNNYEKNIFKQVVSWF
jgi:molecular chaperone DnaK (HSP70)